MHIFKGVYRVCDTLTNMYMLFILFISILMEYNFELTLRCIIKQRYYL